MKFTERQKHIIDIVKSNEPISGDNIAEQLGLTKSTLRSDLAILTMTGILDARPKVGYIYSGLGFEPLIQEQLSAKTVQDIMILPVIIGQETTVHDAITDLFMYDVGSLYVVDNETKELLGLVSRKDLLRSMMTGGHSETAIGIVMTRMPNIVTTYPEMTALNAAKLISRHQIDSLPVVKEKGSKEVIGKISKTTLVNLLIELGDKGTH